MGDKKDTDSFILVREAMLSLSMNREIRSLVTTLDLQANKKKIEKKPLGITAHKKSL